MLHQRLLIWQTRILWLWTGRSYTYYRRCWIRHWNTSCLSKTRDDVIWIFWEDDLFRFRPTARRMDDRTSYVRTRSMDRKHPMGEEYDYGGETKRSFRVMGLPGKNRGWPRPTATTKWEFSSRGVEKFSQWQYGEGSRNNCYKFLKWRLLSAFHD